MTTETKTKNPTVAKLAKHLKNWEVDPSDWYTNSADVNSAMRDAGIENIWLQWYMTEDDGSVHVFFFSAKIGERITLDSDITLEYNNLKDMAETLVEYAEQAAKLEAALPKIDYATF